MPSIIRVLALNSSDERRQVLRRRRGKKGISSIIGTIFFILIFLLGFSVITVMFNSFINYSTTVNNSNQLAMQTRETSLSVSGFNFGSPDPVSTVATSTSDAQSYIQITLTNSQNSATPNPFQEQITWNPSTYSAYEVSNLGNIRFCSTNTCSVELYAWLQQCGTSFTSCTSSSTSAIAWVQLTTSIASNGGTLTIYMVFQSTAINFDGNYWGEAPTLSGSYGQYDNGANVFPVYDNFAGTSGPSGSWTQVINRGAISDSNGLTFTTYKSSEYAFVWWNTVQNYPVIAETYVASVGSGTEPMIGVSTSANANSYTGLYNGISLSWVQGTTTITLASQTSGGGTSRGTATVSATFTPGIWGVTWRATNAESGSAQGGTATGTSSPAIANYAIYIGQTANGASSDTMDWARMRAYPPNGVMPSSSFTLFPGASAPTSYSFERKVLYSQGLWWAFYSDGTNIGYSTSTDGNTWSSETIVTSSTGSTRGYNFNLWVSSNSLYYILTASAQSNSFQWRYGTLQSSGSITWSISQTAVTTTNTVYSYNSIVVDNSGNVWVALNTNDGTNTHIEVWQYSSGAWAKVNDISPLPSDAVPILVPLSSGVALIYGEGSVTATTDITTSATGSSWTSVVSPASNYFLLSSSSATAIGNTVYFVGLGSTSTGVTAGSVEFWSYTSGGSSVSAVTTIQSSASNWMTTISEEQPRTLIVFYGSGSNVYEIDSESSGATWNSIATISTSENSITGLTSAYSAGAALWTSGSSEPFNVRFAGFSTLVVSNNSPFPVHLISLYIYDSNANTLVHFDTNPSGSGVSGLFDYWLGSGETMSIPIQSFAWSTSQSYLLTITTDQGVLYSYSLTSPT